MKKTKAKKKSNESSERKKLLKKNIKKLVDKHSIKLKKNNKKIKKIYKINTRNKRNKKNKRKRRIEKLKFLISSIIVIFIIASIIFLKYFPINFPINTPINIPINIPILQYLNIYVVAHKDFYNTLTNPYYKILCDNKTSQLKNQYQLKIIETYEDNELFLKTRGYGEGSKIYYIWKKYKKKEISSKYIGFNHYRRVFNFKNNIPDLDKIFNHSDAIINKKTRFDEKVKTQYANVHFPKFLDEIIDIIKENFTEYYPQAIKTLNQNYFSCCNIFIMKQEDFIKYGEFVFGVLLEFDRRHKLINDKDIKKLLSFEFRNAGLKNFFYQYRIEAFLMERISIIFYDYYFKNSLEIPVTSQ